MYYIYGIYNTINGKLYIGITKNMKRRWYEHTKNSRVLSKQSYAIHFAMHKYGIHNFMYKNIGIANDLAEANEKEIKWIKELKLLGFQLYNETDGGDGTAGYSRPWTEEQKHHMSKLMSGAGNPMYGVQLFGEANGNFGKEMKPHVKEKLLNIRRKLTDEQISEIRTLFETGKYTQTQLSKQFGVSLTQIHRIVRDKSWGNKKHDSIITKKNLTKEDVIEIRFMYASGNYTQKEIAIKYNCSVTHINRIINGKKWKNV